MTDAYEAARAETLRGKYYVQLSVQCVGVDDGQCSVRDRALDALRGAFPELRDKQLIVSIEEWCDEPGLNGPVWPIWCEGYIATGEHGTAHRLGAARGETFREACMKFFKDCKEDYGTYDPKRNSVWGCRLFDNEAEARKSYG